jgi:hypothetical protein
LEEAPGFMEHLALENQKDQEEKISYHSFKKFKNQMHPRKLNKKFGICDDVASLQCYFLCCAKRWKSQRIEVTAI